MGYPGASTVVNQLLDRILILPPRLANPNKPAMSPHSRHLSTMIESVGGEKRGGWGGGMLLNTTWNCFQPLTRGPKDSLWSWPTRQKTRPAQNNHLRKTQNKHTSWKQWRSSWQRYHWHTVFCCVNGACSGKLQVKMLKNRKLQQCWKCWLLKNNPSRKHKRKHVEMKLQQIMWSCPWTSDCWPKAPTKLVSVNFVKYINN